MNFSGFPQDVLGRSRRFEALLFTTDISFVQHELAPSDQVRVSLIAWSNFRSPRSPPDQNHAGKSPPAVDSFASSGLPGGCHRIRFHRFGILRVLIHLAPVEVPDAPAPTQPCNTFRVLSFQIVDAASGIDRFEMRFYQAVVVRMIGVREAMRGQITKMQILATICSSLLCSTN